MKTLAVRSVTLFVLFLAQPISAAILTYATAVGPGPSGFTGQVNPGGTTASSSNSASSGIPTSVSTSWSASANLTQGTLRARVSGSNSGADPTLSNADQTAIAWFGSTVSYSGSSSGNFTANFSVSGSFASDLSGSGSVINSSLATLYLLQPGSFDQNCITCGNNLIAKYIFGIGPNFQDNPYFSYGNIEQTASLPGTVNFAIPLTTSQLSSGFQLIFLLQPYIIASNGGSNQTPGQLNSFSYTMDLGNTVTFDLGVPSDLTLLDSGGLPTTVVPVGEVPEPAQWPVVCAVLAGLGGVRMRARFAKQKS